MIKLSDWAHLLSYIVLFFKFDFNDAYMGFEPIQCSPVPEEFGKNVRIPPTWIPMHYDLALQPHLMNTNFTYRGKVGIILTAKNNTNTLYINSVDIHVDYIEIKQIVPAGDVIIPIFRYYCDMEMIGIYSPTPLRTERLYEMTIDFKAKLRTDNDGLQVTDYMDDTKQLAYGVVTDFSPTNARKAFPCYDEPLAKCTIKLILLHPHDMVALSVMPVDKTNQLNAYWKQTTFAMTPRMPTYMLSIFLGNLPKLEEGRVSIYGEPEFIKTAQFALYFTIQVIKKFEKLFKTVFLLPKIIQIALRDYKTEPDENLGLVTYAKDHLSYDSNIHSESIKAFVANIISHMMVQQMFASWATPCWWDDLFVSKGCTVFFQYVGLKLHYPEKNMEELFVSDVLFLMMQKDDNNLFEVAIDSYVPNDREQILKSFNYFSYGKAAAIIRMLGYHIGYENFWESLQRLIHQKNPQCSTDDILYDTMYEVSKKNNFDFEKYYYKEWFDNEDNFTSIHETKGQNPLSSFVQSWTLTGGYPIVLVYRNYDNGTITIYQTHSVVERQGTFAIPISYTRGEEKNFKPETRFILNTKSHEFVMEGLANDDWVIFNVQSEGFYRVDYDLPNWKMLINTLWTSHEVFPAITRAQMMHDLWRLVTEDTGYLKTFLDASRYLSFETRSPAILIYADVFRCLYTMSKNSKSLTTELFDFTNLILKKKYDTYEWKTFDNFKDCNCILRTKLIYLMCLIGNENCRKQARDHFTRWMSNPYTYRIPVELKFLIFLYGLQGGTSQEREFLVKCQEDPKFVNESEAIKSSFEGEEIIKSLFEAQFIKDSDIRIHKLYYQSSYQEDIYENYLIHDVDHRDAEATYFETFLVSNKQSGKEYETDMLDYFSKWHEEKDTFFKNSEEKAKTSKITPYEDRGYTLMNKFV